MYLLHNPWEYPYSEGMTTPAGRQDRSIHLPQPSYWPFVCSMGLLIAGYGAVYISSIIGMVVTAIGFMTTMFAVYAWSFEPVNDPEDSH